MPRGEKSKYSSKQKRQARHIEESYTERGTPRKDAQSRAWATVNKSTGGGKMGGSGRGRRTSNASAKRGGTRGGRSAAARPTAARSASARKAARTRKRNA